MAIRMEFTNAQFRPLHPQIYLLNLCLYKIHWTWVPTSLWLEHAMYYTCYLSLYRQKKEESRGKHSENTVENKNHLDSVLQLFRGAYTFLKTILVSVLPFLIIPRNLTDGHLELTAAVCKICALYDEMNWEQHKQSSGLGKSQPWIEVGGSSTGCFTKWTCQVNIYVYTY